jgi:hypothetical protein
MLQQFPITPTTQLTQKVESPWRKIISRLLSVVMVSGAFTYLIVRNQANQFAMSKAAYLANEAINYDQNTAQYQTATIIAMFILICIFLCVYELIAYVIYKVIAEHPI